MTLEELFKEACGKGLTHFTLYPVESMDRKTIFWACRATPSTGHSYIQTQTLDPIEAITETLKALPKAPKRANTPKPRFDSVNPPLSELAQRAVTGAVTLDENVGSPDAHRPSTTVGEIDKPELTTFDDWMPKP